VDQLVCHPSLDNICQSTSVLNYQDLAKLFTQDTSVNLETPAEGGLEQVGVMVEPIECLDYVLGVSGLFLQLESLSLTIYKGRKSLCLDFPIKTCIA
jgi:hypothetical protein